MLDATIKQDYATTLDYSYPKFVQAHGGKDSILKLLNEGFKKMKAQGMELIIKSGSLGEPSNQVKIDSLLFSVVSEKLILNMNGSDYVTTSSLIAISSDNGNNWTFVDAAGLDDLKTFIPGIDQLTIPKSTGPTLIKGN